MTRARHTPTETLPLSKVALAIGKKPGATLDLLNRTGLYATHARLGGRAVVFNQRVVDVLHALLGQPHRPLEGAEADWLPVYTTSGGTHAP